MKKYKVYKGLQKEIRLFYLNRALAIQWIVVNVFQMGFFVVVIGLNNLTLLLIIGLFFLTYFLFKQMDRINRKQNLKKKRANRKKPTIIKRMPNQMTKTNGLFNQSN